jgi:hypothetical protein
MAELLYALNPKNAKFPPNVPARAYQVSSFRFHVSGYLKARPFDRNAESPDTFCRQAMWKQKTLATNYTNSTNY